MKEYLAKIDTIRSQRVLPVTNGNQGALQLNNTAQLPTKVNGLYWLYTNYSFQEISDCSPSSQNNSVNMSELAKLHNGLAYINKFKHDGFNLVYNGVGGVGPKGHGGLRERIQQEFNGGSGTGSLGILQSSLNDLERWRFSYVILCSTKILPDIDVCYDTYGTAFERMWRLEFGWPLLCKH